MQQSSKKRTAFLPVLLSFFVMSFIDLVGTGVDELKKDASVPHYILQLIPFAAFIWFFLLSVPVGIWQDGLGKKKMVLIGIYLTSVGLFIPMLGNTLPIVLCAFTVLGAGNAIIQVAANPLLIDVIPGNKQASYLSISQFVKAAGSMAGPFVAALAGPWIANLAGDQSAGSWRYGLYLFAIVSLFIAFALHKTTIIEIQNTEKKATFKSALNLLSNSFILKMVLGIFLIVGIDVSMNSTQAEYLSLKIGMNTDIAKYGKSLYFFAKMAGTFLGAILLTRIPSRKFMLGTSLLLLASFVAFLFIDTAQMAWTIVVLISLASANVFPLIFSISVEKMPNQKNEISGLIMMAVSGGAIIPFIVSWGMSKIDTGGVFILILSAVYLVIIAISKPQKH